MLEIEIQSTEFWDEVHQEFVMIPGGKLCLEHSLISLAKWESKWNKPFLTDNAMTAEEIRDYVRCMTINKNVESAMYLGLTSDDYEKVNRYISAPMTATTFNDHRPEGSSRRRKGEIMTAEIIYYYMISFGIPFDCEKWHLSRLLTLIRVCSIKNAPKEKMSKSAAAKQQRSLNAQRRAAHRSHG